MSIVKKVLIVEDHPIFSTGLRQLLESDSVYMVVAELTNRITALEFLQENTVDIVIVDLGLGDDNGLDLLKDIRIRFPLLSAIVLSMHDERYHAERALAAGARAYVMKQEASRTVLEAISTVLSGKIWLSPRLSNQTDSNLLKSPLDVLSDRELEIFTQIGKGLGTAEIAELLNLSVKTVDSHKEHLKVKLGQPDTKMLRKYAIEWQSGQGKAK